MENNIKELRDELFATLRALRDPEKPMDIERAKAIADVAKVVIDSAKVEVDFMRVTGEAYGSGFIPAERQLPAGPQPVPPRRRIARG